MTLVEYLVRKYNIDHCTQQMIGEYFHEVRRSHDTINGQIPEYVKGVIYGRYDAASLYLIYGHIFDRKTQDRVIDLMRNWCFRAF